MAPQGTRRAYKGTRSSFSCILPYSQPKIRDTRWCQNFCVQGVNSLSSFACTSMIGKRIKKVPFYATLPWRFYLHLWPSGSSHSKSDICNGRMVYNPILNDNTRHPVPLGGLFWRTSLLEQSVAKYSKESTLGSTFLVKVSSRETFMLHVYLEVSWDGNVL